jgi:hypothetical protein
LKQHLKETRMKEDYSTPELVEYPPLTDVTGGSVDDVIPL